MPTMKKKTEQDFADVAHQQSLAWARLKEPKLGKAEDDQGLSKALTDDELEKAWSDEAREASAEARKKNLGEESSGSRELRLFADNDRDLHRQSMQPIRDNLGRKIDKGTYDPEKAKTLWGYHADRAAQSYVKAHGAPGEKWHQMFSPATRREAAAHWEADEYDDIKDGSSRTFKG
jgi:hypothetical protein